VSRIEAGVWRLRRLGIGLLLAGACALMPQASPDAAAGVDPTGTKSKPRLAPEAANAETAPNDQGTRERPRSTRRRSKAGARAKPPVPHAATVTAGDAKSRGFTQLSGAQVEQRIIEQRQILRLDPRDEVARQTLGLIVVELGNRVLDLDELDNKQALAHWTEVIRKDLHDTLWRASQLAKSDGRAAAALALFYSEGILAGRDSEKGCELYARAAQSGHLAAAYHAALCKTRTEPALAKTLLERAAEKGHAGAEELMGRACIEAERKDYACARNWLERAAKKGRPSAMSLLGWLHASDPERPDLAKSVGYYRAAAESGDEAAQNNLGELYETGRGVSQDAAQAVAWYARAAETGFPPAQINLARMYAAGTGVAQDLATARAWAERAQQQGQGQAQVLLDWLAARH
jgi:TPR repeat protein